ncbi:MAG: hypothetical protein ILA02_03565 [Clostridia bacterium]|nr:hypothetical protein [Clostridia bacterium]
MNKKKKEIRLGTILLVIIMVLAISIILFKLVNNTKYVEKNDVVFKIKDIKCLKGQEVNVEIELLNDSDFVAANFEYKYDGDSLEYINYEIGESLKDGAMTIVNNDDKNKKILIGFVAKPDGEKTIKAGKIIDIKFKVKEALTKNKIENIFDCTTLKKEDGTDINSSIQQGVIEINNVGGGIN